MTNNSFNEKFEEIYKQSAQAISIAPGRVNLIGEFTDYNNGFVLPCALEFATRILYKKREDNKVVVHSLHYPGEHDEFSIDGDITPGESQWGNYIRAVAFVFKRQGHQLCGLDLLIDSNVPQGSGLSSSAALEVSMGGIFNQACQLNLSGQAIALLGQEAENDFMDCQCGIMDQLVSANGKKGHALLMDCRSLETQSVSIPEDLSIVIVNSNYPRKLVDSEYNQRRIDCEEAASKMSVSSLRDATLDNLNAARSIMTDNEYKRAHHVITENHRVLNAVEALKNNNMKTLRELMTASHQSLKNDFEVTVPETDGLVQICQEALGTQGAVRMTGGGFGGAIVCLCRHDDIAKIKEAVEAQYHARFNIHASIYVGKAGDGLQVSEL
ncbi:galactokinase [Pseudocolwellia sp. AS88]|uniref:galactokinase n=1 Tax=Pseudocolwellia sp. AS88 TaxID=3063958 RepID=UPI0026EA98E1|nr:galactokinase [Pseudocolwellia sp. AS88]MDO7084787.1 galactokinase [Pseudocolwellia sp. AS88]